VSISAENATHESVAASHALPEPTAEEAVQLEQLYKDFEQGEPGSVVDGDR
jgi:gentisate 1,2-dioxygenase